MHPEPVVVPGSGVPEVEQERRPIDPAVSRGREWQMIHAPEVEQDWYFTFGGDHVHPITGESLRQAYVKIAGTCDSSRELMLRIFGQRWSNQYATADAAGVARFELRQVELPPVPRLPAAGVEERTEEQGPAVLLDELREEYVQAEADQDRKPTEAGFLAWLARRARAEECPGCRDILTRAVGGVEERTEEVHYRQAIGDPLGCGRETVKLSTDDSAYVTCFGCLEALGAAGCIVEHFTPTGDPIVQSTRAVLIEIEDLRRQVTALHETNEALAATVSAAYRGRDAVLEEVAALREAVNVARDISMDRTDWLVKKLDRIASAVQEEQQ